MTTTAERLKEIMALQGLRQIDVLEKCKPYCQAAGTKLGRSDLSQYISGKVKPRQEKLTILGQALNVSEAWLMGYDVPKERPIKTSSEVSEGAPIDPRLVRIAKQMCRQDPVVLDVYDSEDRGKLVDYAELLYGAQDGRHLATAAHSSAGKVKPETMAQMEDDDLWK